MTTVVAETSKTTENGVTVTAKLVRRDDEPLFIALAVGDESGDVMIADLDPVTAGLLAADLTLLADVADR